ncbi:LytR/AlgR family response regulator transcription factor [Maribacter sp. 2-571]|uniref:LytR/AlgR family response regulator transcription factor n=1 Tax=Maribacter sp. 2-571 TaxID=3417569 RepID=UPI003D331731
MRESHIDFLFIRANRKQLKVSLDDILYIRSVKDYIKIYLSGRTYMIKPSSAAFQERLNGRFLRVHRSYIVNATKTSAYTKLDAEIGEIETPIGKTTER